MACGVHLLLTNQNAMLRSLSLLTALLCVSSWGMAQTDGPLGATRWTGGASWNADGSVDDAPNSGPINGVIRCGSAAETQSQIASTGVYDPSLFEIVPPAGGCVEPSSGNSVSIQAPTAGEPIIWFNFDVRPSAGTYEIQINDNSGDVIAWALYASNAPTLGTSTSPLTGEELSGDPTDLMFLTCGVESANTWNTLPVPNFPQATNCYLAVWDTQADGDLQINNFKARFGCGDSDVELCIVDITDVAAQCDGANYTVDVTIEGINGYYQLSDPNALELPDPAIVCLGNVATGGDLFGTFTFTYASGVDYDITVEAVPGVSGCADTPNYADCYVNVTGSGLDCAIPGCMDECACNYIASANVSDGSCDFDCHGCIYASASNYDASATYDDGTCIFEGCMHDECVTYNELATLQPQGACDNPSGFADFDANGIVQVNDLSDMLQAFAAADSDWNGVEWIQDACNGSSEDATGDFVASEPECVLSGCMYPSALNYDPMAVQDPGVCAFPGCTDMTATNYNVHANIEDGSCRYVQCPDFNRDGLVQIADLMDFLSVYGKVYE